MNSIRALRIALAVSLAALAIPCSSVAAQKPSEKVDLTGSWSFDVSTSVGTGTPTVTLTQKGDSLTGHYSSAALGEAEITGSARDGKFSFRATVSVQGTSFDVVYSGTIESKDALKGDV